jgi:hypothetical protein
MTIVLIIDLSGLRSGAAAGAHAGSVTAGLGAARRNGGYAGCSQLIIHGVPN